MPKPSRRPSRRYVWLRGFNLRPRHYFDELDKEDENSTRLEEIPSASGEQSSDDDRQPVQRQYSFAPSMAFGDVGPDSRLRYLSGKGEISFWRNFSYEEQGHPFLPTTHDVNMEDIANAMHKEFKIRTPRIVLVVVSNIAPLHAWSNERQLQHFQNGIIKAANTTEMWIVTHGTNLGITKVIGDAVHDELLKRQAMRCHKHPNRSHASLPPLTLIGIVREDLIIYGDMLDGRQHRVEIENEGNQPDENKYELNPDHSHFIIVKDNTVNKTGINHFLLKLEQHLSTVPDMSYTNVKGKSAGHDRQPDACSLTSNGIPVVSLLIQGGYDCARLTLDHLKRQLPVVVLRGSGGLADLLAYAYYEISHRPQGIQDAEFIENFLKPELSSKIVHNFIRFRDNNLARNIFRNRILECVRYAHQNGQVYLTVLNLHSHSSNLENLDDFLLRALFKSQKSDATNWHMQMQKDLHLTLDWNSPHVAMSEVFFKDPSNKFKVDKFIFEEALTRPKREDFVDLFLTQGFQIHKFLIPRRLKALFAKIQSEEFFRSICWEGALGHGLTTKIRKNFIDSDLNWLIEICIGIGNFVNTQEMSLNAVGMYVSDPSAAERKSLVILTMWAVFSNRSKLAKLLWKHSDQPIHLALVVSMIYDKLQDFVGDTNLQLELQNSSREFSEMAAGVLDSSYSDSSCRAYDVLSEENSDWAYKTAVDIAADAKNRTFLSHPCCQKWLSDMFLGNIQVRDLAWGVITVPQWLKVTLCAFLIFPMYVWIRFRPGHLHPWESSFTPDYDSDEERDEHDGDDPAYEDSLPGKESHLVKRDSVVRYKSEKSKMFDFGHGKHREQVATLLREKEVFIRSPPPIWRMIYLMWSAPITKFWTFQIFYMIYLGLFCLAVLWPSCGNKYLDIVVCVWTSLIVVEYIRRTYILYKKYTSVPLFFKCVEITLIIIFIILYILGRILNVGVFLDPYNGKVLLCVGLLYFFYRLIAVYLPISPTLGPLLYRVKLMVLVDFVNFMRMTLLVIISGGVVIHAVLYPDYPLTPELFRRTFHRAWFSLFLTPIGDLEGDARCHVYKNFSREENYCLVGKYSDFTCPSTGLWPYIFSIQYFVFLKLILLTLLYALFSATASKLQAETDAIWKFQRYQLVVDFANRLRLPPPLSAFSYILIFFNCLYRCLTCKSCKKRDEPDLCFGAGDLGKGHRLSEKDYNYWRQLAQDYSNKKEEEENEKDISKKQLEIMMTITEDVDYQKTVLRQLKGRLRELERMMTHSHVYLENIKHLTEKAEERGLITTTLIHILSRHTPYPGTRVQRFPVPDKYVPWEVMWTDYDPIAYTRPKSDFPVTLQPYVDEDILLARELQGIDLKLPVFQWNCRSVNPAGISIDRESWIVGDDDTPVIYKLDSESVPRNIFGRTGLRGRGALPRWGPNHYVFVIITRWQKSVGKALDFVAMRGERRDQLSLPGGFIPGENRYELVQHLFQHKETTHETRVSHDQMIEFFQKISVVDPQLEEIALSEMKSEMLCRGYMDDPWNTDQAWREVELWHVHYPESEKLADFFQPVLSWRLITEDVFIKMPAGQAVLLQMVTNRLQPVIF